MIKKIIISSMAFLGMSLATLYQADSMEIVPVVEDRVDSMVYEPIVVLELFTSQGCSSCPPADWLLDKVKTQFPDEVFALSYHVDYWNYIGWEDPFSKAEYTDKQSSYTKKFNHYTDYTPQLVVNGREHFVGSDALKLYASINKYAAENPSNKVRLKNVQSTTSEVKFDYAVSGQIEDKKLRVVLVLEERTTQVKRGENRNRALKNSNIVISEKYIPLEVKNGRATLPKPPVVVSSDKMSVMAIVEADNMDITAADKEPLY
ncbi:DUF1223 domain-containing protein [Flagellimonas myxillae]|uniref:DUF1223 domain-containing protein n=1 Tax=Flagellimonas myxillae TaxID=2942214 RepID=UPI00201ED944|nr:DUF1223 domain-containing protein [Muricauda myxillae]MCL6266271.1 DUF1223 domain-containing protein [Muricauda myxillae]